MIKLMIENINNGVKLNENGAFVIGFSSIIVSSFFIKGSLIVSVLIVAFSNALTALPKQNCFTLSSLAFWMPIAYVVPAIDQASSVFSISAILSA